MYGQLDMIFNGTVVPSTCNTSALTFQDSPSSPAIMYRLQHQSTFCEQLGVSASAFRLRINRQDYFVILEMPGLWKSADNAYLSIDEGFLLDAGGVYVDHVPSSNAIQTNEFLANRIPPAVVSFEVDMDAGILIVTFDDSDGLVNTQTINYSKIAIQNPLTNSVTLNCGISLMQEVFSAELHLLIDRRMLNNLKRNSICRSVSSCLGMFDEGAFFNPSATESSSYGPLAATVVHDDVTPVVLLSFTLLNLSDGSISISFLEPIDTTTLRVEGIYFTKSANGPPTVSVEESFTVVGGDTLSTELQLSMHGDDFARLQSSPGLCVARENCFLALPLYFVSDTSLNPFLPSLDSVAESVGFFQPEVIDTDSVQFVLWSFALDMNTGMLRMNFSESLIISTIRPNLVTLQNKARNSTQSLTLTDSTAESVSAESELSLGIILSETDLNGIKLLEFLATSQENTFISIAEFTVLSVRNVSLTPINMTCALPLEAGYFTADSTPPQLRTFEINFNVLQLRLSFDEPVQIPTDLDDLSSGIQFFSNATQPAMNISLSGSISFVKYANKEDSDQSFISTVLLVGLSEEKIREVKVLDEMDGDLYISVSDGSTVADYSNITLMSVVLVQTGENYHRN